MKSGRSVLRRLDVRQASPYTYCAPLHSNSCEPVVISLGPMLARLIGAKSRRADSCPQLSIAIIGSWRRSRVSSSRVGTGRRCMPLTLLCWAGWGYSGRLKYLQMCRSVIVSHPLRYIQHFHHLFNTDDRSPHQNMVEVAMPLEDHLPQAMQALIEDDQRAERIASNSWSYLRQRYLTPAAK